MTKPLTAEDYLARAEACQEAAEHLAMEWTNDPRERIAGEYIARKLLQQSIAWQRRVRKELTANYR